MGVALRAETSGEQLPLRRWPWLATTLPRRWTQDLLWQRILRSSLGTPPALCPPHVGASVGISTELCAASDLKTLPTRAGAGVYWGTLGQSASMGPSIALDAGGRRARRCLSLALSGRCRQRACGYLGIALTPVPLGRKQQCWGGIWLESFRSPCLLPTSATRSGGHRPNVSSRFYLLLSCPKFAWLFFKQTLGNLSDSLALLVSPWTRRFMWTLRNQT